MVARHPSLLLMLIAALALTACAGRTTVESDLGMKGAPDWVNEGTQMLRDRKGRLFHGVGEAASMSDRSLQIAVADNRARAELARILSSYMEVVGSDFASASGQGGAVDQSVSRQIRSFTKVNLSGARIIAHWRDKKTGIIYALAELDMNDVEKTLRAVRDMNGGLKAHIQNQGGNIFDRLTEERQ